MILPVIMAGGSGSRLWPLSRKLYPKQFLSLTESGTMLQSTVKRLGTIEHMAPMFICNEDHRFIVAEQLRQQAVEHSGIILEPIGRNTAPAIALAALQAVKDGEDPTLLVLAADHVIQNEIAFINAVKQAIDPAESGSLVTFGIVPTSPETGYGYIKQGDAAGQGVFEVLEFVEKPDSVTAQEYLNSGKYLWNSGMFMFKASRYLEEIAAHCPEILDNCRAAIEHAQKDLEFTRVSKEYFEHCPDDSIDYAVMEKTSKALVVPMDADWSDVGSWSALWDVSNKDAKGNAIRGDVLLDGTEDSFVYSQNKLIAAVGVERLVIVETKDAVLVACKDQVQNVKNIVDQLKKAKRTEHLQHREVYRPWGSHDAIAEGERFHVKRVTVKPGEKTATQIHYNRAEHWIVVSGTARVKNGDKEYLLAENESTYIPIGAAHSLQNPGKVALELIEVRSGTYLDDDDVVRVEDYGQGY
ncbi:mannose-1-phosphate guanylyltransferase/mannose-6-phosphate isomerase [Grimontia sp. NTOU-MAR1]|uniref:mannose-1-phosphate guanylyltransferase/mannose-6-phosphate isomerase n=1 Tax=Grimontia sp. NTOU-MAR1 TaxID=3111011 RepID=UPI002DBFBA3A|nr:mannose-1-phosphate guanylyltransferase/mannose-6-phosphate isomerase [Grimontia sp. NTOU-MAR1]WRV97530.1 mannose-1-phosphate guanylyltransferase/mannose-6-phosphate isomerase [Grimontia sp. NTOU-MAR1]